MYKSVSSTIIGGLYTLQYSESLNIGTTRTVVPESDSNESESLNIGSLNIGSLNIGRRGSVILESESNVEVDVDEVEGQNESDLAIIRLNQQIIDISSVVNSRDIEIDRLVKELEVFVCKVCKFRFVNIVIKPCYHTTCSRCMEVFVNSYINDSNSRKNCPCCNTIMQHVEKMYFS